MKKSLLLIILSGCCRFSARGQQYEVLHHFLPAPSVPIEMTQGYDGNFYGTTARGGYGNGTVFKMDPAGQLTILHYFGGGEGASPSSGLLQTSDGSFYGTTAQGGPAGEGTVFKITPSGDLTMLYSFFRENGEGPEGGLVQGSDGNFYGTTGFGGDDGTGTVFKITPTGALTRLHSFTFNEGANPTGILTQGNDGNFYGTTRNGGTNGLGTVFKITPAGAFTMLYSFSGDSGSSPAGGLVRGDDDNFYGTTASGGANGNGTVFRIDLSGNLTTIYSFLQPTVDGAYPASGLIRGSDGNFYGTTARPTAIYNNNTGDVYSVTNGTVFTITPSGNLTTLYRFTPDEGVGPGRLVQGNDGNFYGATARGGPTDNGSIFKITPSGALTTLHLFPQEDGFFPQGLMEGSDGNFYGTTFRGGANLMGTTFKMTPAGEMTTLHSFAGPDSEGSRPQAGLIQGSDGNFYGTTAFGGANDMGTVFKMDASGNVTSLHDFVGNLVDGVSPQAPLLQASDGNYYGTTIGGGPNHAGTVFRVTPPGVVTTLHFFSIDEGAGLQGTLIEGSDGNLYGTAEFGGLSNQGTVFKISRLGNVTTLHSFAGQPLEGESPSAGLIQTSDGNLYGTTFRGGANDRGTVFKLSPSGVLKTLHSFAGDDGSQPSAELVQGSDGNFYGTTEFGGLGERGTVFKITPSGILTTLHAFTFADGASPGGLVQGSDGNLYGTAAGGNGSSGVIFRISFPSPVPLLSVASRKIHGNAGSFNTDLPLTGAPGIECRSGGANGDYTILFSFANTLTGVGGVSVSNGTGGVSSSAINGDPHEYIVNLTGVTNAQTISVSLTNVNDSAGNFSSAISVSMAVLLGDTNADRFVNSGDISQTKSQSGNTVTSSNFREDANADGFLNSGDISLVKSKSGTALP